MSTVSQLARQRSDFAAPGTSASAILGQLEALDNVLRLSLKTSVQADPSAASAPPAAPAQPALDPEPVAPRPRGSEPNFATAFDLLGRASEAMDVLQNRCNELESAAKVRADHFKMALDLAQQQIRTSEARAASIEAELVEGAALLAAASERAETAERLAETAGRLAETADQRIEAAEQRAEAAERSAADAAELLKCYYERIVAAFSMCSEPDLLKPVA